MVVTPPSDDELRELLTAHAHRHPIKSSITVLGDGGRPVKLPLLLCSPSAVCDLPEGDKPSPAWAQLLATLLHLQPKNSNLSTQVAKDCVLWPDVPTLNAWAQRWPGLPGQIVNALSIKLGMGDALEEPAFDEEPPPAIAAALNAKPTAAWRRLMVRDGRFSVVIVPPAPAAFRIFSDALTQAKKDPWPIVRDSTVTGITAMVDEVTGETVEARAVFKRWPGLAVLLIGEIRALAGAGAEVELGNW